jgi:hypothetical protein
VGLSETGRASCKTKPRICTYLMRATSGCGGRGRLVENVCAGGDMAGGLLAVTAPVGARLSVQAWCTRMLVPLRHVLGRGGIGGVLVVCRICRAGTCDGWIYRQSAVRLGLLRLGILMAAPIWQRHGRTCWCLRHPSAAPIGVASGVVGALHVWESGGPRSGRVHAVFRSGSGRVGVAG